MLLNKMGRLIVKPIPVPKGFIHPPPPSEILPRHEFSMGLIGKFYCVFTVCLLFFMGVPSQIFDQIVTTIPIDVING